MWKRSFDILASLGLLALFAAPMLVIAALVKLTSRGPVLYWSDRVGRDNELFPMPKFRTMRTDTPEVATHLLADSRSWITPIGRLLRVTSLDELPQLWSVIVGHMSLVGPRPALHNQDDLIALRTEHGVHVLRPGLTGWAQLNGRDELPIPTKVAFDAEYLERRSFRFDLWILLATVVSVVRRDGVKQADSAQPVSNETANDTDRRAA